MPWKQKGQPFAGFSKGMSQPNPFFGCRKPSLLLCCKKQGGQGSFSKQRPVLPRNCCAACTSDWSQLSWNSFKGIDIWLCSIWKYKLIGNQPIFLLHLGIIRKIINIHREANLQDQTESRLDLTRSPTTMTTVPSEAFLSKLSSVLEKAFVLDYTQYNDFILATALAAMATTLSQTPNREKSGKSLKIHGVASN